MKKIYKLSYISGSDTAWLEKVLDVDTWQEALDEFDKFPLSKKNKGGREYNILALYSNHEVIAKAYVNLNKMPNPEQYFQEQ